LYYFINNIVEAMFYFAFVGNSMFMNYRMYLIFNHSKDIWDCLSVTKFDFTSCGLQGRHTLIAWRNLSIKYTSLYALSFLTMLIFYVLAPVVFSNTLMTMKNHDGSSSVYRPNVINLYLFVSEETYNTYFNVFHIIESFAVSITVFLLIVFDTIVNTLAIALCGQFEVITTAFESVGHNYLHSPNSKYWHVYVLEEFKRRNIFSPRFHFYNFTLTIIQYSICVDIDE